MSNYKRIPSRSDLYQSTILEVACSHELLDIFTEHDSIYKKLNPYHYNDEIAELEDQLKVELWRIIEDNLTDRQKEVVKMSAQGKTQMEIAKALNVNQSSIVKCLAPESIISFDGAQMSMHEIWQTWQHDPSQIRKLPILCLNLDHTAIIHSNIKDVMHNGVKDLLTVTTSSGKTIRATADHKFWTEHGWMKLADIVLNDLRVMVYDGRLRFESIVEYGSGGQDVAYDIEVVSEYHNFVGNGILCKNCIQGNVDYKIRDAKGKPTVYGGVKLKLQKIVKDDPRVNEILQRIADLRDNDPF